MSDYTKVVEKLIEIIPQGLVEDLGVPVAGRMCVEAAVCYALGLDHSDNPPCVGAAVRNFKIKLNDSAWSSKEARAEGMLKIAVAQLGSNSLDQQEFAQRLTMKIVNRLLPEVYSEVLPDYQTEYLKTATTIEEAKEAADAAASDAYTAADASDASDAYIAAAAAAAYAADASDAAYAAAAAAAYAAAAAPNQNHDKYLKMAADICLEVLQEMGSEGCDYLTMLED